MRAIDCQAFAGGFTLGVVQAGWTLVGKREAAGGFGMRQCETNRRLLGDGWEGQASDPADWAPANVELFFTNPPCSGFSVLSNNKFRGINSSINQCMWDAVELAIKCQPETFILESVQSAFKQGLPLMRDLRDRLEIGTGYRYHLTHILQDNLSLGGCSKRPRYFMVCSREPFGVEVPTLERVPTVGAAIGDLLDQPMTFEPRPYESDPTWWSRRQRSMLGVVDGHETARDSASIRRLLDLTRVPWHEGEGEATVAQRYYDTHGELPASWRAHRRQDGLTKAEWAVANGFDFGMFQRNRWRWEQPARVVTGAGPTIALHPQRPRFFTHREIARIMGFPDDWVTYPLRDYRPLETGWGKGVSVDAGRWVAHWARESLLGRPGQYDQGVVSHYLKTAANVRHESVIDVSKHYKTVVDLEVAA
jgi:site-specific DNA-cytosine methylase